MIRIAGALLIALGLLTGCSDNGEPAADPTPTPTSSAAPTPAKPAPEPELGACYRLTYDQAVAPTSDQKKVSCKSKHTAQTFYVGRLHTLVDGHLLAVDSEQVQQQVSTSCPKHMSQFLGGSAEDLRLSMLSSVWFSPTVEESDAGQDWFRCEVVSLAGGDTLRPLTLPMKGVLATEEGRDTFGMCGTDRPGTKGFERVACSQSHSWRAVSTIDVQPGKGAAWPGQEAARNAGEETCQDAVRDRADDPLTFTWGYEWPTKKQWKAGQHHGFCWAPAS